jgi:hypothetical protein
LDTPAVKPLFEGHVAYALPAFDSGTHALALLPHAQAELHETTVYGRALAGAAQASRPVTVTAITRGRRHFAVTERLMCG